MSYFNGRSKDYSVVASHSALSHWASITGARSTLTGATKFQLKDKLDEMSDRSSDQRKYMKSSSFDVAANIELGEPTIENNVFPKGIFAMVPHTESVEDLQDKKVITFWNGAKFKVQNEIFATNSVIGVTDQELSQKSASASKNAFQPSSNGVVSVLNFLYNPEKKTGRFRKNERLYLTFPSDEEYPNMKRILMEETDGQCCENPIVPMLVPSKMADDDMKKANECLGLVFVAAGSSSGTPRKNILEKVSITHI